MVSQQYHKLQINWKDLFNVWKALGYSSRLNTFIFIFGEEYLTEHFQESHLTIICGQTVTIIDEDIYCNSPALNTIFIKISVHLLYLT